MPRPNAVAGTFTVEFDFLDRTTGKPTTEEYKTPIGQGITLYEERDGGRVITDEPPIVSNKSPYKGELTQHELDWLNTLPGIEYNMCYRFKVTKNRE